MPYNTVDREVGEKQEHESYYELSEKWVSANHLKKGDKVLLCDGRYGIIYSIKVEELKSAETTYNLEVEDFHTYYVGEQSVCVHNMNGSDCGANKPKSPRKVDDSYIKSNDIDAHSFKNKAGKIPKNQISKYDIFQDTALKNKLWIGNKAQTKWVETDYYFNDLKFYWRK